MPKERVHGFTIAEVLVGVALLGFLTLVATRLTTQTSIDSQKMNDESDASALISALRTYMQPSGGQSARGCLDSFVTPNVKLLTTPQNFQFENFKGYGYAGNWLKGGVQISPRLQLKSVTLAEKAGINTTVKVVIQGTTYWYRTAQITLQYQTQGTTDHDAKWVDHPDATIETPVYVDAAVGGQIKKCVSADTLEDSCRTIGGTWDPVAKVCNPGTTCITQGNYSTVTCTPPNYGCNYTIANPRLTQVPSDPAVAPPAPSAYGNPELNGQAACPTGSAPSHMGNTQTTDTLSCGKKCSFNVYTYTDFYLCLRCR